jgi:hypothetical protein
MSHLKIESARRQLGTALVLFLVGAGLASAAPAHAQQQSNVEKVCYGSIPQETMREIVRKAVAKTTDPSTKPYMGNSIDELIKGIYWEVRRDVEALTRGVDGTGRQVKRLSPSDLPAFTRLDMNDSALGEKAMTVCFTEVQEAVAKRQAAIAESKKPVNQLFVAYKLYAHVQFCHQVRQGYMVVWINEVELERARQAAKAVEKVALSENPDLDTDTLWRKAKEAAKGFRAWDWSCRAVFSELLAMSPVSPYKSEKP